MKAVLLSQYRNNKILFVTFCAAVILVLVSLFLLRATGRELSSAATSAAILGIIAMGQTFVLLIGGIDFSMQWVLCASAICVSKLYVESELALYNIPVVVILLVVLAGATLVGCINGIGIAYFDINPMIMTFCVNILLHGVMLAWTNGISGLFMPPEIRYFLNRNWGGVPLLMYIWLILAITASFILVRTSFGRKIYAISSNPRVASFSGIRVKKMKLLAYCISGFIAGLGGILMAACEGRSYLGMGDNTVIQAILVVAIGGTSISGGRGGFFGSVIGTIALTALTFIFSRLYVPAGISQIILGVILMAAIIVASPYKKRALKRAPSEN